MQQSVKCQIEYEPLPAQRKFHQSLAKFKAFVGGIGSGKTHAGAIEAILFCILNAGCTYMVVSASYKMLEDATKPMFFKLLPREFIRHRWDSRQELELINGTIVKFRSADDPDKLRGPNIAGFWIDEAGQCKPLIWKIMLGRIRQTPFNLAGIITTTPKGMNWIHTEFIKKCRNNPARQDSYFIIHAETKDNIHNPPEFYESLTESYSGRWAQQELEGKFVAFAGLVYPDFEERIHVKSSDAILSRKYVRLIAAIDYGFTNPTAILIFGIDNDDRYYVLHEFYQTKQTTPAVVDATLALQSLAGHLDQVYVDPSQAELIQQLTQAGLEAVGADNPIIDGLLTVTQALRTREDGFPRLFISEECVHLIEELGQYRYPEGKEERNREEKPIKANDHACDALRYGLHSDRHGSMIMGEFA